jgi:hypothetical protein
MELFMSLQKKFVIILTAVILLFIATTTILITMLVLTNRTSENAAAGKALISDAELDYIHSEMFDMFADNFEWQMNSVEKRTLADAERMANYSGKNGALTPEQLKKFINPNFPYTEVYYALETDGKYVGTSDSADMSVDYRTRPWYVGAKSVKGVFITEPYDTVTNSSGEKIITFSYPIFDSSKNIIGVYGIDMNGSELISRFLPRDLAPYITGILLINGDGSIAPFFDYESVGTLVDSPYFTDITSDNHAWTIRIFGDFTEYDKILGNMSFEEAKSSFDLDAVKQMTYQLTSSTDYIKFNVQRNASVYKSIEVEKTPAFMKNIAMSVNTESWAYDDVYFVFETDGKYIGTDSTVDTDIDFRTRPWYITAKESSGAIWTDFYQSITGSQTKIMTFTAPLQDENGNFVGAVGFDITTETAKSMLYNGDASLEALLILIK